MQRKLVALSFAVICWSFLAAGAAGAGWRNWYDGSPGAPWWEFDTRTPGGILFIRRPGQKIWSLGGVITSRKVTVIEDAEGVPTRTTFVYASAFHSPTSLHNLHYAHGAVRVVVPDEHGLLYVDGSSTPLTGPVQILTTPLLEVGQAHVYHLRAAFRSGDRLLIEDRTVTVPAGRRTSVTFDGANAVAVPLPRRPLNSGGPEPLPPPRQVP